MPPSSTSVPPSSTPTSISRTLGAGFLFGIPLGDLGWFASLLMSVASGFAAFFAATFVGIVSLLVYNSAGHHAADYSISYRLVGLPVGLLVLVVAGSYLGLLWVRRITRRA